MIRFRFAALWIFFLAILIVAGGWNFWIRPNSAAPANSATLTAARELPFEVVRSFPHDPSAFTQGLLWHADHLIEGTGLTGRSELRRVELESGKVLQRRKLPDDVFGEGVALVENRLIQLSWQNERAFVFDEKTFAEIKEWEYSGDGWGLTFDGKNLIMSDGSDKLAFRDPQTFEVVSTLPVTFNGKPLKNINELEWIGGEVWANVWQTDYIVRINPQTGVVESYLDCSQLLGSQSRNGREDVLNGIAYDAKTKRIFVTGKLWPRLFEIKLQNP